MEPGPYVVSIATQARQSVGRTFAGLESKAHHLHDQSHCKPHGPTGRQKQKGLPCLEMTWHCSAHQNPPKATWERALSCLEACEWNREETDVVDGEAQEQRAADLDGGAGTHPPWHHIPNHRGRTDEKTGPRGT